MDGDGDYDNDYYPDYEDNYEDYDDDNEEDEVPESEEELRDSTLMVFFKLLAGIGTLLGITFVAIKFCTNEYDSPGSAS